MAEQCRPDRAGDKADGINAEGLQCPNERVGGGKVQMREDERGDENIEQEIVGLDHRADRAGDHRAAQLPTVLGVAERDCAHTCCSHQLPPRFCG